ncbi:MAG: class I SAM-dependent methyltransferase [Lapillicoccus sp.]
MLPLYRATIQALGPLAGRRLLDAGCGSGRALHEAAVLGARVTGLDATPQLLEIAHRDTPEADLAVGDVQDLPFASDTFDVVTAFNSIQYAVDPAAAAAELARVCRSRGRVAIGFWGEPARGEADNLLKQVGSLAPPPPETPAPLVFNDAGVVEGLLTETGLHVDGGDEVLISLTFITLDDAWTAYSSIGPVQKVIDQAGAEPVRRVIDAVLEADRKPDGQLRQDNILRYVLATKP